MPQMRNGKTHEEVFTDINVEECEEGDYTTITNDSPKRLYIYQIIKYRSN